ncbi:hypothetical protein AMTRI_Chr03g138290 [Amborella trichopoda]
MELLELLLVAAKPVVKVLIITALGSFLALGRVDILGPEAKEHLNRVVFFVFTPALVYSKLSKTITWNSLMLLWFMPINILLTFIVGSALGCVLIKITKPPPHLRGLIISTCSAGNLGNLLLIIVPALCQEQGSPFGDADTCDSYGNAYAALSMAIGAIFIWSYTYNILRMYANGSTNETEGPNGAAESTYTCSFPEESSNLPENGHAVGESSCQRLLSSVHNENQITISLIRSTETPHKQKAPMLKRVSNMLSNLHLEKLLAPSTIAVLIGFLVGAISPIRSTIVSSSGPLRVVQDAVTLLGEGAIPSLTLILGANLLKGLNSSEMRINLIIGIIIMRYILLPLAGIGIIKLASHLGLISSDPLYKFILLTQYALPPAMAIGTMTQLFGAGQSECSIIFLWTYALAILSLTLWSTFFLVLVS